ncbi:hypothetical protein Dip518_000406 [Parelusimicrobium proximum]|uniref:hypothetical protein n=1 Tax=Parelusimicrobium proximum TaxID=3228953 RepID=UPI003D18483C
MKFKAAVLIVFLCLSAYSFGQGSILPAVLKEGGKIILYPKSFQFLGGAAFRGDMVNVMISLYNNEGVIIENGKALTLEGKSPLGTLTPETVKLLSKEIDKYYAENFSVARGPALKNKTWKINQDVVKKIRNLRERERYVAKHPYTVVREDYDILFDMMFTADGRADFLRLQEIYKEFNLERAPASTEEERLMDGLAGAYISYRVLAEQIELLGGYDKQMLERYFRAVDDYADYAARLSYYTYEHTGIDFYEGILKDDYKILSSIPGARELNVYRYAAISASAKKIIIESEIEDITCFPASFFPNIEMEADGRTHFAVLHKSQLADVKEKAGTGLKLASDMKNTARLRLLKTLKQ